MTDYIYKIILGLLIACLCLLIYTFLTLLFKKNIQFGKLKIKLQ